MTLPADAKTFLRNFKSLVDFAESIVDAGDLDLQTKEMEQRKVDAQNVRDTTIQELENTKRHIVEARGKLRDLEQKAASIVEVAQKEAAYITDKARDELIDLRAAADDAITEQTNAAKQELAEIRQEIGRLDKQKNSLVEEMAKLQAAIDELKRKFI